MSSRTIRCIALACALSAACLASAAEAYQERATTPATVTNSASEMLPAYAGPRTFLSVSNESETATIACRIGGTPDFHAAGSYTLAPGQSIQWGPTGTQFPVPGGAVNCISSEASSPATIESSP